MARRQRREGRNGSWKNERIFLFVIVGRTDACFFPPSPSSTYKQPAEALKRVFPLPLYVVVQNASAIEQNAHFKMWIAGGKKPCLHFANEPSPAACFDVVRHCKRCKSGRPGCYYPCNPPASHAAARRPALSSRMLRARRSKGAAARSSSLRCQITKFGHFLRGHHIYDACMCVLPPKSALR